MVFLALIHYVAGQPGNLGAGVSFAARTRFQSRPSSSAESWAADRTHHSVLDLRPAELAVFEPLGEQAHARSVPEYQLHPVRPTTDILHMVFATGGLRTVGIRCSIGRCGSRGTGAAKI